VRQRLSVGDEIAAHEVIAEEAVLRILVLAAAEADRSPTRRRRPTRSWAVFLAMQEDTWGGLPDRDNRLTRTL
jgi:hypothetical protein